MTKIIEVIVSPKGETRIETRGFLGASCREASKFIEEALGRSTSDHTTAEFFQSSVSSQNDAKQQN